MTNTLTSNTKPFQWFPKVNSNLLAAVSLIILCSTIFLMAQPISAGDCSSAQDAYDAALDALDAALEALEEAEEAYDEAGLLEKPQAYLRVLAAMAAVGAAGVAVGAAWVALKLCEASCDGSGSGGCDSGGCG